MYKQAFEFYFDGVLRSLRVVSSGNEGATAYEGGGTTNTRGLLVFCTKNTENTVKI
mgnify:FL=1